MSKLAGGSLGTETAVYYSEMESPIGPLTLCATEAGLCLIEFGTFAGSRENLEKWLKVRIGTVILIEDESRLKLLL